MYEIIPGLTRISNITNSWLWAEEGERMENFDVKSTTAEREKGYKTPNHSLPLSEGDQLCCKPWQEELDDEGVIAL